MTSKEQTIKNALSEIKKLMPALLKSEKDDLYLVIPSEEERKAASDWWYGKTK